MKTLNIHEAKTNLSAVLKELEETHETFLICRNGHPIADLVPHQKKKRTTIHPLLSKITINYDPTEELSNDEWEGIDDAP